MTGHGNSPQWVAREAQRRFPLNLTARIEWMYEQAYSSTSESDRHEILTAIRRLRNGVTA